MGRKWSYCTVLTSYTNQVRREQVLIFKGFQRNPKLPTLTSVTRDPGEVVPSWSRAAT